MFALAYGLSPRGGAPGKTDRRDPLGRNWMPKESFSERARVEWGDGVVTDVIYHVERGKGCVAVVFGRCWR